MTTLPPLAALASRLRGLFRPRFILRHEWAGIEYPITCRPHRMRDALAGIEDPDLADVHRDALAYDAERGRLPSRRGVYWTLLRDGK